MIIEGFEDVKKPAERKEGEGEGGSEGRWSG